jgi:hypothetical protein
LDKAIERSPGRIGIRSIWVQSATHSQNLSSKLRACCSDATRSYPDETCYKALSGLNLGTIGRSQIIRSYSQFIRSSTIGCRFSFNPSTGAEIQIAAARTVKFTAGQAFKDADNA